MSDPTIPTDPRQVQSMIQMYKLRPDMFSLDETSALKQMAQETGLPFQTNQEQDAIHLINYPKQLLGGFISGFTAFIDPFEKPTTEGEETAKSVGNLMGFLGVLFPQSAISKGLSVSELAAKTIEGAAIVGKVEAGGEAMAAFTKSANWFRSAQPLRSVPMQVADFVRNKFIKSAAFEAMTPFLAERPFAKQVVESALHLGVASTVASAKDGWKAAIEGGFWGSVTGGIWAGVGNIPGLTAQTTLSNMARAAAGSLVSGLPATIEGASTHRQAYEYLLGAYFGYHAPDVKMFELGNLYDEMDPNRPRIAYKSDPAYIKLTNPAKDRIDKAMSLLNKPQQAWTIARAMSMSVHDEADKMINWQALKEGDIIRDQRTGIAGAITAKNEADNTFTIATEDGGTASVSADVAEHITQDKQPHPGDVDVDATDENLAKGVDLIRDLKNMVPTIRLSSNLSEIARTIIPPEDLLDPEALIGYHRAINNDVNKAIEMSKNGENGYEYFLQRMKDIHASAFRNSPDKPALGEDDFAPFIREYNDRMSQVNAKRGVVDKTGNLKEYRTSANGATYNQQQNRVNPTRTKSPNDNSPGDLLMVAEMADDHGKAWNMYEIKFHDSAEKRDAAKALDPIGHHRLWSELFNAGKGRGMYMYTVRGEKGDVMYRSYHPDAATKKDAVFTEMRENIPDFDAQYAVDWKRAQGYESQTDFDRALVSNALYYKELNNSERLTDLMTEGFLGGDPKSAILAWNKRQQPLMSDYAPLRSDVIAGKKFKYAIVQDPFTGHEKAMTDGAIIVSRDAWQRMQKGAGLTGTMGHMKPFLLQQHPELGMLIGKAAFHIAHDEESAWMKKYGLDMYAYGSAIKQRGKRVIQSTDYKTGFNPEHTYELSPEDIRVSTGVRDDVEEKVAGAHRLVVQINKFMDGLTDPKARAAFAKYKEEMIGGIDKANGILRDYLALTKPEAKRALLEQIFKMKDGEFTPDALVHDLGHVNFFKAMTEDREFRQLGRQYVAGLRVENMGDDTEMFNQSLSDNEIQEEASIALRMLKYSKGSDAIALSHQTKEMHDAMMTNYFVRRTVSPKIREAGKAVMAPMSLWMQGSGETGPRFNLTEDNFYLGDGYKDMPFRDHNGEWTTLGEFHDKLTNIPKNTKTTDKDLGEIALLAGARNLKKYERKGEQYVQFDYDTPDVQNTSGSLPLEDFTPEQIKEKVDLAGKLTEKQRMQKRLRAVVLRVPMNNISGAQSLKFAGFTGIQGGGILLHGLNMERLGGADLDIDTAFHYWNMPDEVHSELIKHRHDQDAYFGEEYKNSQNMFLKDTKVDLKSKYSMFSPFARASVGFDVANGRNTMMGRVVTNRFLVQGLLDTANKMREKNGKAVFKIRSPKNEDRNSHWAEIELTPRQDKGFMFGLAGKNAMDVAADVGRMRDPAEVNAILFKAAFEKIVAQRWDKKSQSWIGKEIGANTAIDQKSGTVTIDKDLVDFVATGVSKYKFGLYGIEPFKALQDVNSKLFSRNYKEGRKWTRQEMVESAKRFLVTAKQYPVLDGQALKEDIARVAEMSDRDSNLLRTLPRIKEQYAKVLEFNKIVKAISDGKQRGFELFPFLNSGSGKAGTVPFRDLADRMNVFLKWTQDKEYNWLNESGIEKIIRDPEKFNQLLDDLSKTYTNGGKHPVPKYNNIGEFLQRPVRRQREGESGYIPTLGERFFYKDGKANFSGRRSWMRNMRNSLDVYLSKAMDDFTSLKLGKAAYDAANLNPDDVIGLLGEISSVKHDYQKFLTAKQDHNADPNTYLDLIERLSTIRKNYITQMGERGKDPVAVSNFVDSLIFGTLRDNEQTQWSRLGGEVVGDHIVKAWDRVYAETFDLFDKPFNKQSIASYVGFTREQEREIRRLPSKKDIRDVHIGIWRPPGEDVKLDPDMQKLQRRIDNVMNYYGWSRGPEVFKLCRELTNLAQPEDMTKADLERFVDVLESLKMGPSVIRRFKKWLDKTGERGFAVDAAESFRFALTSSDNLMTQYIKLIPNDAINHDGTLNEAKMPLRHYDTIEEKLKWVFADTMSPVSHFHPIIKAFFRAEQFTAQRNADYSLMANTKLKRWARPVYQHMGKDDESAKLLDTASRLYEYHGARNEWLENGTEENRQNMNNRWSDFLQMKDYYTSIKDKMFDINEGAEKQEGRDVINNIMADVDDLAKTFWSEYIAVVPEWSNRNVKTVVGSVVDQSKSFLDVNKLFHQAVIKDIVSDPATRITHDNVRYMLYVQEMASKVAEGVEKHTRPLVADVMKLKYGDAGEWAQSFPDLVNTNKDGQLDYLHYYKNTIDASRLADPTAQKNALDALRGRAMSKQHVDAINKALGDIENLPKDQVDASYDSAQRLIWYFGKSVNGLDARQVIHKIDRYSQYERDLEFAKGTLKAKDHLWMQLEDDDPFRHTGRRSGYWPHMDFDQKSVEAWQAEQLIAIQKKYGENVDEGSPEAEQRNFEVGKLEHKVAQILGKEYTPDGFESAQIAEQFTSVNRGLKFLQTLGANKTTGNLLRREANVPGWSRDLSVWHKYGTQINNSIYSNLAAYHARRVLDNFEAPMKEILHRFGYQNIQDAWKSDKWKQISDVMAKELPMGRYQSDWAMWMRMYVRDNMGAPSFMSAEFTDSPTVKLRNIPYHWVSDQAFIVPGTTANKVARLFFGKDFEEDPMKFASKMRRFSTLEGKYEMATLLAAPKVAIGNILGMEMNNVIYTGLRHRLGARDFKIWQDINPEWKTMKDVDAAIAEMGGVENWIANLGNVITKRFKFRGEQFLHEWGQKIKEGDVPAWEVTKSMARKYGIMDTFMEKAAWFMRESEMRNRIIAWKSSYLQLRESISPMRLNWDNPWLIEKTREAVGFTQFLYGSSARPAFARTNLGVVYSRFKLWAWSNVRFQRTIAREAALMGYNPRSIEGQRFNRMMTANAFVLGLATLLPFSLFDNQLPPPLTYFQNLSDWIFGGKKDRERAFMSGSSFMPTALAPLNELMPPISRIPKGLYDLPKTFEILMSGQASRLGEVTSYTLFPFGRMLKDVYRAYDDPTKAADFLLAFPQHPLAQLKQKMKQNNTPSN